VADRRRNRAASLLVVRPSRSRPTIAGAINPRGVHRDRFVIARIASLVS